MKHVGHFIACERLPADNGSQVFNPSSGKPTAIAAVATVGYSAYLFGQPTIGLVAEQLTLRGSFVILLALLVVVALLAPAVKNIRST